MKDDPRVELVDGFFNESLTAELQKKLLSGLLYLTVNKAPKYITVAMNLLKTNAMIAPITP